MKEILIHAAKTAAKTAIIFGIFLLCAATFFTSWAERIG